MWPFISRRCRCADAQQGGPGLVRSDQFLRRHFAKTGDPNGRGLPLWPAFTDENQPVMVFDGSSGARTYPLLEKAKMLDTYFDEGSDHGGHH